MADNAKPKHMGIKKVTSIGKSTLSRINHKSKRQHKKYRGQGKP